MFKSIFYPIRAHRNLNKYLIKNFSAYKKILYEKYPVPNTGILNYKLNNKYSKVYLSTSSVQHAKLFQEAENLHAYSILQNIPLVSDFLPKRGSPSKKMNNADFEKILNENYRTESATKIVTTFQDVLPYSIENDIALDDIRFNNLVDGLMDKCQDLTNTELSELLFTISKYPPVDSYKSHNFHDIWSALDDVCLGRLRTWSTGQQFQIAEHWFNLHLTRVCDYVHEFLRLLSRKTNKLNAEELVHAFFYMNAARKSAIIFEFEHELRKHIKNLTVDQMAVISMGYFKTKSTIKIPEIMEQMLEQLIKNITTTHEISLTAILKILRYSTNLKHVNMYNSLLDKLVDEVDRLSILCCVHIALLGTNTQIFHAKVLTKISQKFVANINAVRLKDIERMLFALSTYDFDPKTEPCIYAAIFEQLHDSSRRAHEFKRHPRCLPCALHFLSFRGIYSHPLTATVLSKQYIVDTYGRSSRNVGREIFALDQSIGLECPDYKGDRLSADQQHKVAKWLTEYFPTKVQPKKITAVEKLMLQIQDEVTDIVGGEQHVFIHHVLPHYPRADIIVCKNNKSGRFVKPVGFENYVLGDIMYPNKSEDLTWYALIIASWNNTIRLTSKPLGNITMKIRHLKLAGFEPVLITYNDFVVMNPTERKNYILDKLS